MYKNINPKLKVDLSIRSKKAKPQFIQVMMGVLSPFKNLELLNFRNPNINKKSITLLLN
jgi:hypothetical protein